MRTVSKRAVLGAMLAALLAATVPSTVAVADDPEVVSFFGCVAAAGGNTTVTADEPYLLRFGWGAKNRGLVNQYIQATTHTLTVDGEPQPNVEDHWGDPFADPGPPPRWGAWIHYPLVAPASGETVTVTLSLHLSHRLHDGMSRDDDGRLIFAGPGTWLEASCNVTGA